MVWIMWSSVPLSESMFQLECGVSDSPSILVPTSLAQVHRAAFVSVQEHPWRGWAYERCIDFHHSASPRAIWTHFLPFVLSLEPSSHLRCDLQYWKVEAKGQRRRSPQWVVDSAVQGSVAGSSQIPTRLRSRCLGKTKGKTSRVIG